MAKTKAEKIYQEKYRKAHPEFDKKYRQKHWVLRVTFTTAERDRLKKMFGEELHRTARRLIRTELLKREFMAPDSPPENQSPIPVV
jgi:hypothetical protein